MNRLLEKTEPGKTELQGLLEMIYRECGFDFRDYRITTLTRRLDRRMRSRRVETYNEYAEVLQRDPTEYEKIFDYLTINVTNFFRDEIHFKVLEETVLPAIIGKNDKCGKKIRVWSAGCSTGEEPYSIAILLAELLGSGMKNWDIKILATDIDAKALSQADNGVFASKGVANIKDPRMKKYFIPREKSFRIKPAIRRLVAFEEDNLVDDTRYRDIDLVVCRNVLIYFTARLQSLVLKNFYEAMKGEAFLFLGKAEVTGEKTRMLFKCIDKEAKVYRKT